MPDRPKRLYLIDGANYFFRAFYAIRHLSNSKGLPTGALYGFAQMLLKLLREEAPDLVAVCFDTPEPTFRDEMYGGYKANRKAPPDDIVQQFPYMRPIAEALGLPVIEKPGFEADDVIGTLAARYAARGCDVVIVSGDKDLMQLVGPGVTILDEMKGSRVGPREVEEKFGVGPEGVVEVLGLAGDVSDNIPGVPGIGPKTAQSLIRKYGSVEEVIAHAGELKGALAQKMAEHADGARLSRRLAKIATDVEIDVEEEGLCRRKADEAMVRKLFGELEFAKLLEELLPGPKASRGGYRIARGDSELVEVTARIGAAGRCAIVLACGPGGPMSAEIAGVALAWAEGEAAYIQTAVSGEGGASGDLFAHAAGGGTEGLDRGREFLSRILTDPGTAKFGHDLNFAITALNRLGVEVRGPTFDAMIASYLMDPARDHGIEALAQRFLGLGLSTWEDVAGKGKSRRGVWDIAPEALCGFACERADSTLRLSPILHGLLGDAGLLELFEEMEMPLVRVLVEMQIAGVKVDTARLAALGLEFDGRLGRLEGRIHDLAGERFNVNSPRQLGEVLFEKKGIPGGRRTKAGFSTSQDVLEELSAEHEIARLVLDYRSLAKLKGTYIAALPLLVSPATGRIHTSFNQAVTATGRLSSSNPNLQNIPARGEEGRRIREAFVAEEGFVLLSSDYSQIELRVLAHMSGEQRLIAAFDMGEDVHALTAAGIFGVGQSDVTPEQRAVGKTVNFATIYGQGPFGLARQLGIGTGEASDYIANYFKRYPGVAAYREEVLARARREGMVTTLFGRRRFTPDIATANPQLKSLAERAAFNTVFQGTAADIIKRAMIAIHAGLGAVSGGARMILQVHDELLFEAPEADAGRVENFVRAKMEGAAKLKVPLAVDVGTGPNWAEAH